MIENEWAAQRIARGAAGWPRGRKETDLEGLIGAVVFSFVAMLALVAVALAAFLVKFMAPTIAISITIVVVALGLGTMPLGLV